MIEVPIPERAIVISTGRCGSTMLSNLIAEEADTLSVQEFFMAGVARLHRQDHDVVSGAEYWRLLKQPRPEFATMCRLGRMPKEVAYPSTGRYAGDLGQLPPIMAITLPKISDDPDALYDRLGELVPEFPEQSISRHHETLLDLLAHLQGKRSWVERSGGSCYLALSLLESYPSTKIVYLTRNWPDTARSMSRHTSFRMMQLRMEFRNVIGFDPFRDEYTLDDVPEDMVHLLPDRLTAETLEERGKDISRYLMMCAFLTNQTEQVLADRPPAHLHRVRYEDVLEAPVERLTEVGEFLGFADPAEWAGRVADKVGTPKAVATPA